jgi:hypothetical protein
MLRITADVFSGRPNPSTVVVDEAEIRATLKELASQTAVTTDGPGAEAGLGLRGFWVEPLNDELAQDYGVASRLFVPSGSPAGDGRARELSDRLVSLMGAGQPEAGASDALAVEAGFQAYLRGELERTSRASAPDAAATPSAPPEEAAVSPAVTCTIELGAFNPGFWNNDPNVRSHNNCYNYASNKRTDTFAQPGRGCGHMYTAITCAEVTRGALCDGLHRRFTCFPDSEKPRYLVAMVVAPGPGFVDYHWYRKQKEGFWGHKPGGTAARNTDNSNKVITDPSTCNRGPYTLFCGYFYTCRSQRIP